MAFKKYVIDGAKLQCTCGSEEGTLQVISQRVCDIQGKWQATDADKLIKPPFFGNCANKFWSPACVPALLSS